MKSKKGAIELSMTTIIVIVLGVTLLILGLVFVRGIFDKLGGLTEKSFLIADKELQDRIGASDRIYVPGVDFELEPGASTTITIGIQNLATNDEATPSTFKLEVKPGDEASKRLKVTLPPEQSLRIGQSKGLPLKVQLPEGSNPGTSYSLTIRVLKNKELYDEQSIFISV